jgi:hypothetical protein
MPSLGTWRRDARGAGLAEVEAAGRVDGRRGVPPLVFVAWGWQYHQGHPKFDPATYCDDIFAGKHVEPPQDLAIDCSIPSDLRF